MNIIRRTLAIVLCAFFISASVPAQLALGPQALGTVSAPTLKYRKRISSAAITWGMVRRVGGVSFDTVATPANNLRVNSVALDYLPAAADGERLSVMINNQRVLAPVYDWQLIPIAKFADSNLYSCFTLFGELDDEKEQAALSAQGGYAPNYHENFKDTVMGLRLFQLDNLIINPYSWDLVKDGGVYVLAAGESPPNKQRNSQALDNFLGLNPDLRNDSFDSYLISDRRRQAVFRIEGSTLIIQGEPSYTFVRRSIPSDAEISRAVEEAEKEVLAKLEGLSESEGMVWLTEQVIAEAENHDRSVDDDEFIVNPELRQLLSIDARAGRRAALTSDSPESLLEQLIELKVWVRVLKAWEIPALSQRISNQTPGLRAINPAVWDAGVVLLRYAAFFRYCKERNPVQWQQFMSQIGGVTPRPRVVTPNKFVPVGSRQR